MLDEGWAGRWVASGLAGALPGPHALQQTALRERGQSPPAGRWATAETRGWPFPPAFHATCDHGASSPCPAQVPMNYPPYILGKSLKAFSLQMGKLRPR